LDETNRRAVSTWYSQVITATFLFKLAALLASVVSTLGDGLGGTPPPVAVAGGLVDVAGCRGASLEFAGTGQPTPCSIADGGFS
jgi:hypothetical protein